MSDTNTETTSLFRQGCFGAIMAHAIGQTGLSGMIERFTAVHHDDHELLAFAKKIGVPSATLKRLRALDRTAYPIEERWVCDVCHDTALVESDSEPGRFTRCENCNPLAVDPHEKFVP